MNGVETADTVGFQGLSQPGRVATASKYSTVPIIIQHIVQCTVCASAVEPG